MDTFYSWLENHVAIGTWVVASCSFLTFVLSFIFKKKKKDSTHSQNISNVQGTTINQANGNITINSQDVRQERTKY